MNTKKIKKKNPEGVMPFLEHLRELRNRMIFSFISILVFAVAAFIFYFDIIDLLIKPFSGIKGMASTSLFNFSIYEPFTTRIKISFLSGVILSLPVHIYNIIKFIFPGLKKKEKKVIKYSLVSSFLLVLVSGYYSYFKIIPFSVKFLTSANFVPDKVGNMLNFWKNIFFILQFIFGAVLVFQLPVFLELLLYTGIVKRKALWKASRYIIVGIFILSAIVTPPDPASQCLFAVPLILLFYLTILIAKIFKFGEN